MQGILTFGGPFQCRARDETTLERTERTTLPFCIIAGSECTYSRKTLNGVLLGKPSILNQLPDSFKVQAGQSIRLYCVILLHIQSSVTFMWELQRDNELSFQNATDDEVVGKQRRITLEVIGERKANVTYRCKISN